MKLRSDSILSKLTEDQRAELYGWSQEHGCAKALEMAAQPAPEGFGLQIHKTTLVRFVEDERKKRHAQRLAEHAATSDPALSAQDSGLSALIRAARGEFAHAVYELSLAATQAENFDRLERALHHADTVSLHRDQLEIKKQEFELHRERLALDRENFECNAARLALKHAAKLQAVARQPPVDDFEKIQQARRLCFGSLPEDSPQNRPPQQREHNPSERKTHSDTLGHTLILFPLSPPTSPPKNGQTKAGPRTSRKSSPKPQKRQTR